jgi:hypothetical protein
MSEHGADHAAKPYDKHFTSSILLWMRTDRPRQAGMDHWKGPHSGIISATPGLTEYRQVHLAEDNPGRWPATAGVETAIPADRRVDGIAEVTFKSTLSPLMGRTQTQLAFADEVNVFRRTLLYVGPPGSSRWYDVGEAPTGSRAVLYLRRAATTSRGDFRRFVRRELTVALLGAAPLTELRTQVFLPWNEHTWDTPAVAHDNPREHRLHGSVILGFADDTAREAFFTEAAPRLAPLTAGRLAAVHAYDVAITLTFVEGGEILPEPHA